MTCRGQHGRLHNLLQSCTIRYHFHLVVQARTVLGLRYVLPSSNIRLGVAVVEKMPRFQVSVDDATLMEPIEHIHERVAI